MLTSIIISYFVQAPATNFIPGLGMSGIGMAVKMVSLNTLSALALSYWLLKIFKLRFDIKHQLKVSIFCFGWGVCSDKRN
jgi:membrane protease YdiL (CAAX protease family)